MASVTPKLRSRKLGAAIALDDFDKRLLNAMQGSFPIEPRPYASVAAALEVPEERVLARVGELVDERIIRQITPIFDTRALGYGSMLVAAKVDPEHPWRAARIINSHPGVSHNYLRNHDFNMWFTLAVEEDSALGLDGTLDVLQELTGAESIRQLPTLKLFKIRMDLELVGGTDELAKSAVAEDPIELDKQPYDELDMAVIRATQGDMPIVAEPYAAAAARAGHERRRADRAPARDGRPRPAAPRRRDPLPPPRRLQRQRHGRVAGPRRAHRRGRPADGRLPRDLALLPAPDLRRLALLDLHHGPRALQGGVRRDPRRDRRRQPRDPGPRDALQLDRVQEDPPPVLHRGLQGLGTRARGV